MKPMPQSDIKALRKILPLTYEDAGVPQSQWKAWDAVLASRARSVRDKPMYAREFAKLGVDPETARQYFEITDDFDEAVNNAVSGLPPALLAEYRREGIGPMAASLLERGIQRSDLALHSARRHMEMICANWPGIAKLCGSPHRSREDLRKALFFSALTNAVVDDPRVEAFFESDAFPIHDTPRELLDSAFASAHMLGTILEWRWTQTIYRFDDDLFEAMIATNTRDLPSSIFEHLPQSCVYIPIFERLQIGGTGVLGAYISRPTAQHGLTIVASLVGSRASSSMVGARDLLRFTIDKKSPTADEDGHSYYAIASLAAYLCAPEPDLDRAILRIATPQRIKGGTRFFAPSEPQHVEVGLRFGGVLRAARARYEHDVEAARDGRGAMPPHVRSAHWRMVRFGPMAGGDDRPRRAVWIPASFVNMRDLDAVTPTVRDVTA